MLLSGWLKPRSHSIRRSHRRRGNPLGGIRDWLLEDRCLLSGGVLVPGNSNTPLNQIFWNGGAPQQGAPYTGPTVTAAPTVKTITITNNSDQTIYPILRDANTGQDPANTNTNNPKNYYDPEDPIGQEYRAYIGYVGSDGNEYLGLPAGATITIRVPLVFWDAENTYIATDGTDLTPANPTTQSNPFRYNPSSARGVSLSTDSNSWVTSFTDSTGTDSVGLVMFYHAATSQTPSLDSPSQLTEFTIRDPYLNTGGTAPGNGWLTDSAQTKVLFNYDVSYVDNLTSSIAMEAYNVPIPLANNPTPPAANYGWAGSSLIYGSPTTSGTIQNLIQDFIQNTGPASIGQYFGGNGWPSYYNPDGILKIPGGANLFANSPLNGQVSSYFTFGPNNAFMLTSGGTGPVSASSGGAPLTNSQPTQLPLTLTADQRAAFVSNMAAMLANNQEVDLQYALASQPLSPVVGTVTAYDPFAGIQAINVTNGGSGYDSNHPPTVIITPADGKGGGAIATAFVNASGQITGIGIDPNNRGSYDIPPIISFSGTNQSAKATADLFGGTATVKLNSGVNLPTNQPLSYVFSRPATDYASTAITNLWYSWAQYYVSQFTNFVPPPGVTGSIAAGTNVLTLDSPVPSSLDIGMTVSGAGIDPAPGTTVTILGFNPDNVNQIYLSQLSASGSSSGTSYTFGAPQQLPFANTDGIKSITVTKPGSGYTPTTVTFSGGGGSGAAGTVITSNGQVAGVVLTNYGSGYTSAPTVTFSGGLNATGTATINSKTGLLTGVTITKGGSGYLSVNIGGPTGSGASAIATVDPATGSITNVKVINAGSGYNSNNPPSVTFTGGGGSGATATATVGSFVKTFSLTFPTDQQAFAQAFAGSVYEAMEAESAISNYTAKNPLLPGAYSLVYTTLGTDTLDLPNSNGGGSLVGTLVTNLIKSILRGVPDFTNPLYSNPSQWYPNPGFDVKTGEPTGGQKFNVYNLDPYVWFVHTVLGLSGYGFSVDDDTSDVDASASPYTPQNQQVLPNNLQFVFSGLKPAPFNQNEWFPSVPWGTVSDTGTISNPTDGPYANFTIITLTNPLVYYKITNPDLTAGQIGAYVSGPGIPQGTTVTVRQRGDLNNLMLVLNTQIPNLQTTSGTFTFTGAPSSPPPLLGSPPPSPPPSSPPPSSSPPGASVSSSSTLSPVQAIVQLAVDEALLTFDQVFALVGAPLGLVPNSALETSIEAHTNAISANPEAHTLLGQAVINFSFFEALNLLTELSATL